MRIRPSWWQPRARGVHDRRTGGYLYRAEAVDSFPPCLMDGDEPVNEATDLGIRITNTTTPTVQFGGADGFCKADFDGCNLHAGCGIFVGYEKAGYQALTSLDVAFTTALNGAPWRTPSLYDVRGRILPRSTSGSAGRKLSHEPP